MTKDEVKRRVREVSTKAVPQAKQALERGMLVPTALVLYPEREIGIVEIPLDGPEEKRLATDAAAMYWRDRGAIGAIWVAESWISEIPKTPGSLDRPEVDRLPSEDPHRREAVVITKMGAGTGWVEVTMLMFSRDEGGEIVWGETHEGSSVESRSELFKEFWKADARP